MERYERIRKLQNLRQLALELIHHEYSDASVERMNKAEEYKPYYIVISGNAYVEFVCRHPDHAMHKANQEIGKGNWKAILTRKPSNRWIQVTPKQVRDFIHFKKTGQIFADRGDWTMGTR